MVVGGRKTFLSQTRRRVRSTCHTPYNFFPQENHAAKLFFFLAPLERTQFVLIEEADLLYLEAASQLLNIFVVRQT